MSAYQVELLLSFVACAVAIPIIVIGWIRDPWGRELEQQRKADESEARLLCAPQRPHVVAAPIDCPIDDAFAEGDSAAEIERLVDVINEGRAA